MGAIMDSKTPPSSEWWRQNYLLLAYIPYDMAYASKDTLVQEYWPVLQAAYQLAQTISRSNKRPIPPEYSKDVEALFTNIYRVTQPTMYLHAHNSISSDSETISRSTATLLVEISKVLKSLNTNYEGMCCELGKEDNVRRSDLRRLLGAAFEWGKVRTLERRKMYPPLIHNGVMQWPDSANNMWKVDYALSRNFTTKVKDFFFDRLLWWEGTSDNAVNISYTTVPFNYCIILFFWSV